MTSRTEQLFSAGINIKKSIFNSTIHYQLSPEELIEQTIQRKQGRLSSSGALVIETGKFTGRSPEDRFFVDDKFSQEHVNWNNFNKPISEQNFLQLRDKLLNYFNQMEECWMRDCIACAHPLYKMQVSVLTEKPWASLFAYNMFIRPTATELENFVADWQVIQADGFKADPEVDGTRSENFTIISFMHKTILVGGSGYTGELKKGIFTVLNLLLPTQHNVLSMHCSANMGNEGDTAIFFGLSGTGKTTLSADASRQLIGDDEHGWSDDSVFNFEGGCYAKTINLSPENEPEIYDAIRAGALVENTTFIAGTNDIDFTDKSITENTRVSYPLDFVDNALQPSIAPSPKNIFFLTCDAAGVLPPMSRLNPAQAMYQFISGYTAKIAGTEEGITEPKSTFSACFGAPFIPLHPGYYADMLGKKLKEEKVNVWLVNTGWSGGPYGIGQRIRLKFTRHMINAALNGTLNNVAYEVHPIFGFEFPISCADVPVEILNPRNTWKNKELYDEKAFQLAKLFTQNFSKFENGVSEEVLQAAPNVN